MVFIEMLMGKGAATACLGVAKMASMGAMQDLVRGVADFVPPEKLSEMLGALSGLGVTVGTFCGLRACAPQMPEIFLQDQLREPEGPVPCTLADFECVREIGCGGFATVKMVKAKNGLRYALKCVRKQFVVELRCENDLVSELKIMKEVDHPFVIKLFRTFRDATRVYFLMELVTGGELQGPLNHNQAVFYAGSVLLALEHLRKRGIAHMDLNPGNCLIDQRGYLKLIDFGIAQRFGKIDPHGPIKGTKLYMAPEVIARKGDNQAVDLWSLGVCIYELVLDDFPFQHGGSEVLKKAVNFPTWFDNDPDASSTKSLIQQLLTKNPRDRLGAGPEGYKKHVFFAGLCWEKLLAQDLEPPFVPQSETYQTDREQLTMIDEANSEENWKDPAPGWDHEF